MLDALTDVTFRLVAAPDGTVRCIEGLDAANGLLATEVSEQLMDQHRAAWSAAQKKKEPATFDVHCNGSGCARTWALTLVPDGATDESGCVWLGAARDVTRARKSQATLREPASFQQHLAELLPDAVIITDSSDQLLYANSAAAAMLGANDSEALIGRSLWEFVHPTSRSRIHACKQKLRRGETDEIREQKLVRLDGRTVPVETVSVPIRYQGKRAALVTARDLTGRKHMAQALARTLDLFDKAFHLGPSALLIARLDDGVILEASDRMTELTGYAAEELVGRDLRALDLWVDPNTRDELAARLVHEGTVWEAEFPIRRKDGSRRTVLGSAHRVDVRGKACVLASAIDITERRRAASAEKESRALLHTIFHASPTAIGILCVDDDTFLDVNEALCELVGYEADTLTRRPLPELELWRDRAQYAAVVAALKDGTSVYDEEVTLHTADGTRVTTLASFQQIQVDGQPAVLAVMTDITARKDAEETLVQAKEQAEEIAQFRSTLLQNMTHEIRTPLTVILGFTSMLHQGIRDDYRRFVHLIERSGRRLLLTLDSLLDLAQLEAGTLEVDAAVHNVMEVVHSTATSLTDRVAQKELDYTIDLPKTPVYARVDCHLLSHALTHLIDNAVKFTEEGNVTVTADYSNAHVCIHVKDTGVGVGEQFVEHLFDPFAQESEGTNRNHQGNGLGLTVARRLIERLDGTIRHAGREGQGSVFTIELPRVSDA